MQEAIRVLREAGEVAVAFRCVREGCGYSFIADYEESQILHCPVCCADAEAVDLSSLPTREEQVGILLNNLPYTTQLYRRAKRPDQSEWVMRVGVLQVAEGDDILVVLKKGIREVSRIRAEKGSEEK